MDFKITSDLALMQAATIEANFDEMERFLEEEIAPYKSEVVAESSLSSAKAAVAKLRKAKEAIDESRKATKSAVLAPYTAFEEKCKKLTAIIDEGIYNLDKQVKEHIVRQKERKLSLLKEYFDQNSEDVSHYLSWEKIYDVRWGNATYSEKDAQSEIYNKITETRLALNAIRGLNSQFEAELLEHYRNTLDLAGTISKNAALKAVKEYEDRKKAEEANRQYSIDPDVPAKNAAPQVEQAPKNEYYKLSDSEEKRVTVAFKITVTKAQLSALKNFMTENGIVPERV